MREPDIREENLIEACKNYIVATGILNGIQYDNIASVQDAVRKIAETLSDDISVDEKRKKFQEGCRKAAKELLVKDGIIELDPEWKDTGSIHSDLSAKDSGRTHYRVVPGKEQEYYDQIYRARFQKERAESLASLLRFVEKTQKTGSVLLAICKTLNLLPKQVLSAAGHVVAAAAKAGEAAENMDDAKKEIVTKAAEEVSTAVYSDISKAGVVKGTFEEVKKQVDSIAKGILRKRNTVKVNSIADARLDENQNKYVKRQYRGKVTDPHKERRMSLLDMAKTMGNIRDGYQVDMFAAFEDIDKEIRPGKPPVTRKDISKAAEEDTSHKIWNVNAALRSAAGAVTCMKDDLLHVQKSYGILHRLSFIQKHEKDIPAPLYLWYRNYLKQKESINYEKCLRVTSIGKSNFDKAQLNIIHFNAQNRDSRKRGENYAHEYAGLNSYRCGRSSVLVSAMHLYRMNTLDRIWAVAYMKAGMMETLNGIRYMDFQMDANGNFHGPAELRGKAQAIFEACTQGKDITELDRVCEKLEEDFVKDHEAMVDRINEHREKRGMEALQEVNYMNPDLGNAKDPGGKDHLDVVVISLDELEDTDIEDLKSKQLRDGFLIREDYSAGLCLFKEDKTVVALLDENVVATGMKLTNETYHTVKKCKETLREEYGTARDDLRSGDAIRIVSADIADRDAKNLISLNWKQVVSELIRDGMEESRLNENHSSYLIITDPRTGVSMEACAQDDDPGYSKATVKRFAEEVAHAEYESLLEKQGTDWYDALRFLNFAKEEYRSRAEELALSSCDKTGRLEQFRDSYRNLMENPDAKAVLMTESRKELISALEKDLTKQSMDKMHGILRNYEERMREFEYLEQRDPMLAWCRLTVPECKREGNKIVAYAKDGVRVELDRDLRGGPEIQTREARDLTDHLVFAIDTWRQEEAVPEHFRDSSRQEER